MNFDIVMGVAKYDRLDQWEASFGHTEKTLNRNDRVVFAGVLADRYFPHTQEVWLGIGSRPVDRTVIMEQGTKKYLPPFL